MVIILITLGNLFYYWIYFLFSCCMLAIHETYKSKLPILSSFALFYFSFWMLLVLVFSLLKYCNWEDFIKLEHVRFSLLVLACFKTGIQVKLKSLSCAPPPNSYHPLIWLTQLIVFWIIICSTMLILS